MSDRVDKKELIRRIAERLSEDSNAVEKIVDATLEEIYEVLKEEKSISLHNFGSFYIMRKRDGYAFKFNPSQRLRKFFGWTSTYKGEV